MTRSTGTQTRSWSYTGNFLMSATNPENGTISYTYNTGGNNKVSKRTDAKGQATVYTYDSLARLTEVQRYPSGTGNPEDTCQRENYLYDGNEPDPTDGNPVYPSYPQNALGRLSGVMYQGGYLPGGSPTCNTTFIELYTYNAGGAPTGKLLQVDRIFYIFGVGENVAYPVNFTAGFSYDNEGRMTGIQYPAMVDEHSNTYTPDTLSYTYDSMGRPYTATDTTASQTLIAGATYGPANELLSITGASGGWGGESFAHNSIKQLTCLSTSSSCTSSTGVIYNYPSSTNNGKIASQADGVYRNGGRHPPLPTCSRRGLEGADRSGPRTTGILATRYRGRPGLDSGAARGHLRHHRPAQPGAAPAEPGRVQPRPAGAGAGAPHQGLRTSRAPGHWLRAVSA